MTRTFVDKLSDAWHSSPATVWLGALLGLGFQSMFTFANPATTVFPSLAVWLGWMLGQFLFMLLRKKWPLVALIGECGFVIAATVLYSGGSYCFIPLTVVFYSVIARSGTTIIAISMVCVLATAVVASGVNPGSIAPVLCIAAIALVFRLRRQSLVDREARIAAREKQLQAEKSARIATSLHDSVGHNLTAIITLSEGLSGIAPEIDEAVTMINSLARDALTETRTAVKAIYQEESVLDSEHTWTDVAELIDRVRDTGLTVAVTETGTRAEDYEIQNLAHAVIQESLTNVMRHAAGASRTVISLEHQPTQLAITIADNGTPSQISTHGTGIATLRNKIRNVGGELTAGPADKGWRIAATIPRERTL